MVELSRCIAYDDALQGFLFCADNHVNPTKSKIIEDSAIREKVRIKLLIKQIWRIESQRWKKGRKRRGCGYSFRKWFGFGWVLFCCRGGLCRIK